MHSKLKFDSSRTSTVLSKLLKGYQHIAIINNSEDEIVGFITLEDIIESMLGAIDDEYYVLPDFIYKINENRYLIGGGKKIIELNKELKCSFINKDINLSDYLISNIEIKPKNEINVNVDNITFITRKVSRSKIHEIITGIN